MARLASEAIAERPQAAQADGLARLRSLTSPYTGLVRRVHETLRAPDDARMTLMGCQLARGEPTTGSAVDLSAAGANYEPERALGAALGEAIERYSGTCVPRSGPVLATASEIGPEAVDPARFALFHEEQYASDGFPFVPFTGDTKVRWVKGWSIPDGDPAYVPLQLAYMMRSGMCVEGEVEIAQGSSNGMSLALGVEEATLGGLLELVERDAVMLTWANSLIHPRLDWSHDDELIEHESRHFTPAGIPYDVLDLSGFFGVPTAMALMLPRREHGNGGEPVVWGIGAASEPTMRDAWDKAIRECFQIRTALKADLLEDPGRTSLAADEITEPLDHTYYYADPENQARLAFLASSERVRAPADVPDLAGDDAATGVEAIAERLKARGVSAYAVDITPVDVADAGLRVVHVLSPELQPIDFPHRLRFQGGRRLYEAAFELGLRQAPLDRSDLNPEPHPFP